MLVSSPLLPPGGCDDVAGSNRSPHKPPLLVDVVRGRGGGVLARPRSYRGTTVAGQRRDLTGLRWSPQRPDPMPGAASIRRRLFARRPGSCGPENPVGVRV